MCVCASLDLVCLHDAPEHGDVPLLTLYGNKLVGGAATITVTRVQKSTMESIECNNRGVCGEWRDTLTFPPPLRWLPPELRSHSRSLTRAQDAPMGLNERTQLLEAGPRCWGEEGGGACGWLLRCVCQ